VTAHDLLAYLKQQRVELSYRAPRGVMTMVLTGLIKTCRDPLVQLLSTGEDGLLPKVVTLPETDYSRFLTWQTGKVPTSAFMVAPLPEPLYHDVPGVPDTVLGPPCPRKGCAPNALSPSGQPRSTYYRITDLCVRCYTRLKHQLPAELTSTTGDEDELRLL
jgi:hypothetical protein